MKHSSRFKRRMILGSLLLILAVSAREGFCWGWGTHVYINDRLCERRGVFCAEEIYGALGADVVNDLFQFPGYQAYLAGQTHFFGPLEVWEEARSKPAKALALGFFTHNEVTGADFTAHQMGITVDGTQGYVISRAGVLAGALGPVLEAQGVTLSPEAVIDISHVLVETALDIALAQLVDPSIGRKMVDGAIRRSGEFPVLLERAYGESFCGEFGLTDQEGAAFLRYAERQFRSNVLYYGTALTLDLESSIGLLSEYTADVAEGYLMSIDPGLVLPRELVVDLIQFAIAVSLEEIVDVEEFLEELKGTVAFIEGSIAAEGLDY